MARTLSATLLAAQRSESVAPLAKVVLSLIADLCTGGTPTASSSTTGTASNCFDDSFLGGYFWETTTALPAWVKYDFGAGNGKTLTGYTLQAGDSEADRMPKNFTFQGSNNDSDWTTLDTQTNQAFLTCEKKTYTFTNTTAYRYYRVYITAVTESPFAALRVFEIQMFVYTPYTYSGPGGRLLDIKHDEDGPYSQKLTLTLDNSEVPGPLDDLDFSGYDLVLSYGVTVENNYSACAPLTVIDQQKESLPGRVVVIQAAIGNGNQMDEDEASEIYVPTLTETGKTILTGIMNASNAAFDHCAAYAVDYDSIDSLIDTWIPKLNLIIGENDRRQDKAEEVLALTKCVGLFKADGHFHVLVPTTTGTTYDYEYISGAGTHSVYNEKYRQKILKRNYITVASLIGDVPQYSGYATDASYLIKRRDALIRMRLTGNAQGTAVAEALIAKYQVGMEGGSVTVPLNIAAEVFDYVKVTNAQGIVRTGNIGWIHRRVNFMERDPQKQWGMTFGFGGWLGQQSLARALTNTAIGYKAADASITNVAIKKITEVGDTLVKSNDTEGTIAGTSYVLSREILVPTYGYLRVKFDLIGDSSEAGDLYAHGRLAMNAVSDPEAEGKWVGTAQVNQTTAYVTYSEDIDDFKPVTKLQLWTKYSGNPSANAAKWRNFRLYYDVNQSQTGEFINTL